MAKTATLKDIIYATEHAGAHLVHHASVKQGTRRAWSLEPGGVKVAERDANAAIARGNLHGTTVPRPGTVVDETRYSTEAAPADAAE